MNVIRFDRAAGAAGKTSRWSGPLAAIDIGSQKVCCAIARPVGLRKGAEREPAGVQVLGFGHHASQGVGAGAIIDLDAAERTIRLAVDAAEQAAGTTISDVVVNLSAGRPKVEFHRHRINVGGQMITRAHIARVAGEALAGFDAGRRLVIQASPIRFDIDDAHGVGDPEGMYGENLSLDLAVVTAEPGAMHNLATVLERCHLHVRGFVAAAQAAGQAVLVEDEKKLGVTLIDLGAATTSLAVFHDGALVHADMLPIGGNHVTSDIARGLSTTISHAERLKTLFGSALPALFDDSESVAAPVLGENGVEAVQNVPRSMLTGIIRPRIEEIFELLNQRLAASAAAQRAGRRVVITGGASQLCGVREVAGEVLGRQVRMARPARLHGLPDIALGAGFAVVNGLLRHQLQPARFATDVSAICAASGPGYLGRMGRWLRESL